LKDARKISSSYQNHEGKRKRKAAVDRRPRAGSELELTVVPLVIVPFRDVVPDTVNNCDDDLSEVELPAQHFDQP